MDTTPQAKNPPMNAVFQAITLQGKSDIERIELREVRRGQHRKDRILAS